MVEHAPALRTGGYVIDFWGLGYDIAERMGLAEDIDRIGYHMREMRIVDDRGERVAGFGTKVFRELTGGRFVTLGRSDLSRLLFEKIKARRKSYSAMRLSAFKSTGRCAGSIQTRRRASVRSGDRRGRSAFERSRARIRATESV